MHRRYLNVARNALLKEQRLIEILSIRYVSFPLYRPLSPSHPFSTHLNLRNGVNTIHARFKDRENKERRRDDEIRCDQ